jgi:hypothetical protein
MVQTVKSSPVQLGVALSSVMVRYAETRFVEYLVTRFIEVGPRESLLKAGIFRVTIMHSVCAILSR